MKKLVIAIGLGLIAGTVHAACVGPFCYDDSGISIGGRRHDGTGVGIVALSSTTISLMTPAIGDVLLCTTCVNAGDNKYALCMATTTTRGYFVLTSSTTQRCQ